MKYTNPALKEAEWLIKNLPIRLLGDPILTEPCKAVTAAEIKRGQARKWADRLIDFLKKYRRKTGTGRGLAANQVGIPKQMILVWLSDGPKIFLNPKVTRTDGKAIYPESCISAASLIIGDVIRSWKIEIEYTDLDGKKNSLKADPIHSRLLLHEIDHLNGQLCSDNYELGTIRLTGGDKNEILKPKIRRLK